MTRPEKRRRHLERTPPRRGRSRRAGCRRLAAALAKGSAITAAELHPIRASCLPRRQRAETSFGAPSLRHRTAGSRMAAVWARAPGGASSSRTIHFGSEALRARLLDRRGPPRRRARLQALRPAPTDCAPVRLGPRALCRRRRQEHEPAARSGLARRRVPGRVDLVGRAAAGSSSSCWFPPSRMRRPPSTARWPSSMGSSGSGPGRGARVTPKGSGLSWRFLLSDRPPPTSRLDLRARPAGGPPPTRLLVLAGGAWLLVSCSGPTVTSAGMRYSPAPRSSAWCRS